MPVNPESRQTGLLPIQNYTDRIVVHTGGRIENAGGPAFEDDFLGDVIADQYAANADGVGDTAVTSEIEGAIIVYTSAANDEKSEVATELNWAASRSVIFEARVQIEGDITTVNAQVGLNDSKVEPASNLPFSDNDTPTTATNNAILVGYDTDAATNTNWTALTVKSAGTPQALDLGVLPEVDEYNVIRIETNTDGDADFFIDGTYVGTLADAVDAETPLTPYFGCQNRAAATRTVMVDYLHLYQNRTGDADTVTTTTTTTTTTTSTTTTTTTTTP